jgi:hypothetical protein
VKIIFFLGLNMSIYGYGMYGTGYRYPRRKREVKTKIDEPKLWARAAIVNKGMADENPWIQHLRSTGAYKEIRNALLKAKATYVPKNPEKRKTAMQRRKDHLAQELEVLDKDYPELKESYTYTKTPYDLARAKVMDKLVREANLMNIKHGIPLPKGVPKLSLEHLFPGDEGKPFRQYYSKFLSPPKLI